MVNKLRFVAVVTLGWVGATPALVGSLWGQANAPDAQRILAAAQAARVASLAAVQNYTLVQTSGGIELTTYFEKQTIEGQPVFVVVHSSTSSGIPQTGAMGSLSAPPNEARLLEEMGRRARLVGEEEVDGEVCYKLVAEEVDGLDVLSASGAGLTLQKLTLWLDTNEHIVRRLLLDGTMEVEGRPAPVSVNILLQDYRRVEGMYEPFRRTVRISGLAEAATAPGSRRDQGLTALEKQIEGIEQQLASMPEEQRRAMETQWGPTLERMRQTVRSQKAELATPSAGEPIVLTTEVMALRVNSGPPPLNP